VLFGRLGALPDLDLLFGAHSGPTHSGGAAVLAGALLGIQAARRRVFSPAVGVVTAAAACAAAYGSHVLLDWLSRDTTAPIGIMALWPFRREYFESDLHLFMAISRRYYQGWTFVQQNGLAVLRELVILIPVIILVVILRPRLRTQRAKE
jgi:inner membrane protein